MARLHRTVCIYYTLQNLENKYCKKDGFDVGVSAISCQGSYVHAQLCNNDSMGGSKESDRGIGPLLPWKITSDCRIL